MKNNLRHKIISRVSEIDYTRLERIVKLYGFKSVYALLNYITYCFLRVADRAHDTSDDVLPDEIIKMFPIEDDVREIRHAILMSRRRKRHTREGRPSKKNCGISKEIDDLFEEQQQRGRGEEFADNIRKRNER